MLVYVNDLASRVTSVVYLFADDTVLYRLIVTTDNHRTQQEDLRKLEQLESEWSMNFHPDKRSVLTIAKSRKTSQYTYMLHGHTFQKETSIKYLGVALKMT